MAKVAQEVNISDMLRGIMDQFSNPFFLLRRISTEIEVVFENHWYHLVSSVLNSGKIIIYTVNVESY